MPITIAGNHNNTSPTPSPILNPATSSQSGDTKALNQNFDQFLRLLTTQLKHQDPLSPMDSTQFTNQLVSFSNVEQQIKVNENLGKMLAFQKASQTTLGLSYIGLNVEMNGSDFLYSGQPNVGMSYTLPTAAQQATLSIVDKNTGNVVYSQTAQTAAGKHEFLWNGKNQQGQTVPNGMYELRVGAIDASQKSISVSTIVPGRVDGIQTGDDGSIMLLINGFEVPMEDIRKATL